MYAYVLDPCVKFKINASSIADCVTEDSEISLKDEVLELIALWLLDSGAGGEKPFLGDESFFKFCIDWEICWRLLARLLVLPADFLGKNAGSSTCILIRSKCVLNSSSSSVSLKLFAFKRLDELWYKLWDGDRVIGCGDIAVLSTGDIEPSYCCWNVSEYLTEATEKG